MGFAEDLSRLASQVGTRQEHCRGNEEATKHSLILPFFQLLGFDIYDPAVLVPEYKAGFASSKEKIDYAIFQNGAPVLFVEAKPVGARLENYDAQLAKYFNSTVGLKLATITDGVRYKFFTDLKEPNLLDAEPFFEFNLTDLKGEEIEILTGFRCEGFDPAGLVAQAEDLVYLRALKKKVRSIFREPSEDFVRFVAGDIFPRRITQNVLERLTPLVRQAMKGALLEMVSQGLSQEITKADEVEAVVPAADSDQSDKAAPVTTEEELAAFDLVRKMLSEDPRISYKDTSAYLGIQVNNTRGWFLRLYLNGGNRFALVRLPLSQAQQLAPGVEFDEYGEGCRVKIAAISDLNALKAPIVAAYTAVTSPANV